MFDDIVFKYKNLAIKHFDNILQIINIDTLEVLAYWTHNNKNVFELNYYGFRHLDYDNKHFNKMLELGEKLLTK